MSSLISFIIPAYNRAITLPTAIKSVIEQSASNWELVIIDDGSGDDTREIIQKYLKDERIRYFFQDNLGVSAARNRGIAKSRGKYIIFLDSDDQLLSDLLLKLNSIDLKKFDLIFWQVKKVFPTRTEIWKPRKLERIYKGITATFLSGSACYRKSILTGLGGFDEELDFSENYELGLRIAQLEDIKYKVLDQVFLVYNVNPGPERNMTLKKMYAVKHLLQKHNKIYLEDPVSYSRLLHQMGYLLERLRKEKKAKQYYLRSWKIRPGYLKPLLRYLLIKGNIL